MIQRFLCLLLVAGFLVGCTANPLRTSREEWPEVGNEFAKALRWSGPDLAATYVSDSARPAFLASYVDGELQVTNASHHASGPAAENKAQGRLVIEYYRSPSVSIKNSTVPLEWSCFEVGRMMPCQWRITTLLSRLP